MLKDIETAPLEPRMKPILRYARNLTLSPARVTEADAAAVYEVGWGDDVPYSTVLVTAVFNFYNRLVEGVGLAPTAKTFSDCRIGAEGCCRPGHEIGWPRRRSFGE
jgi:hypothetical protein